MELNNLRDLYIDELKDLYSAEKQLVKALPKMAKNATNSQLKEAFTDHLAETEGHVLRLEEIFESLEATPRGKKCVGMEGLIEEAKELIDEDPQEDVLDAGLISKAQHVEHYEMAGYGTVRTYARHGHKKARQSGDLGGLTRCHYWMGLGRVERPTSRLSGSVIRT